MMNIYKFLLYLGSPFLKGWIFYRAWRGKEDPKRMGERFGQTSIMRPRGDLFWFHGASIGESLTYLPLLHHFHKKYPHASFLLTTGTRSAADILSKKLPVRCIHQYIPLDHPSGVKKFLDHWKPSVCFWTEADFWPILLYQTSKRGPVFLLNGRLSEKSFSLWRHFSSFFQSILKCFSVIFPQTSADAKRFSYFKATSINYLGNLKFAPPALLTPKNLEAPLQTLLKSRLFWIASNTHKGEEEIVLKAHKMLLGQFPQLLLILVPRHPHRVVPEIIPLLKSYNFSYKIRSTPTGKNLSNENIYVIDTFGEVFSFYALSHLVFLGGSLIPHIGGHNLLEPLRFYNMVLTGPYMANNKDLAQKSIQSKIIQEIKDETSLAKAVESYILKKVDRKPIQKFLKEQDVLPLYIEAIEKELKKTHVANS